MSIDQSEDASDIDHIQSLCSLEAGKAAKSAGVLKRSKNERSFYVEGPSSTSLGAGPRQHSQLLLTLSGRASIKCEMLNRIVGYYIIFVRSSHHLDRFLLWNCHCLSFHTPIINNKYESC